MTTNLTVTQSQLDACERHIDENGTVYYTVTSATDPDGFYTVRWNKQYHCPSDNCKAGREGRACWHKRAAIAAEQEYQTSKRVEREADEAEALASRSPEEVATEAAIQSYVAQGQDLETAIRLATAPAAEQGPKGSLGYFHTTGFQLLK